MKTGEPPKEIKTRKRDYSRLGSGANSVVYKAGSKDNAYALKVFKHPDLSDLDIHVGQTLKSNGVTKDVAEFIDANSKRGYLRMEYISGTKPISINERKGISLRKAKMHLDDDKKENRIKGIRVDYGATLYQGGQEIHVPSASSESHSAIPEGWGYTPASAFTPANPPPSRPETPLNQWSGETYSFFHTDGTFDPAQDFREANGSRTAYATSDYSTVLGPSQRNV